MKRIVIYVFAAILVLCASCNLEPAEALTFEPSSGTAAPGSSLSVSISNSIENSQIRYTIDETDPTYESALYDGPIVISKNTVLKAAAFKSKRMVSAIATATYTVKAALPTATASTEPIAEGVYASGTQITLDCTTQGTFIYYTKDGTTTPSESSYEYVEPITLTKNTTLKVIAIGTLHNDSDVLTVTYNIKAATPTVDVAAGTYASGTQVTLSCSTPDVSIYYTTDGTTPTSSSAKYSEPITLTKNNTTIKAIAIDSLNVDSDVLSVTYNVRTAKPTASVESGAYGTSQSVTLSSTTNGATIYYTIDGTTPTTSSAVYSSAIPLTNSIIPTSKTLKVIATANDCLNSDVVSYTYILYTAGPAGGYVFYDCDADNDETNDGAGPDNLKSTTCGWRYLEAAPADIAVGTTTGLMFGFYRALDNESNLYVNGSITYVEGTSNPNDGKSTGTAIGTGKANTAKLVDKMCSAAYSDSTGSATTENYAAKLCDDYTYGGCNDWFLPSMDELNLIFYTLKTNDFGGFDSDNYWSSSENKYTAFTAWYQDFSNGYQRNYYRNCTYRVRAVRSFLSFEED